MAGAYLVVLPETSGRFLPGGNDRFVVYAEDTTDAKDIVKDYFRGDSDALVAAATVTAVAAGTDLADWSLAVQVQDASPVINLEVTNGGESHLKTAAVAAAGTGYLANDTIEFADGTGTSAIIKVLTVGGGGEISTVSIVRHGSYSVNPDLTANAGTQTTVGGAGATFNLTMVVDTIEALAAKMVDALNGLAAIAGASFNASTNVLTVAAIADGLGDKQLAAQVYGPNGNAAMSAYVGAIVDGGIAGAVLTVALAAESRAVPTVLAALKAQ